MWIALLIHIDNNSFIILWFGYLFNIYHNLVPYILKSIFHFLNKMLLHVSSCLRDCNIIVISCDESCTWCNYDVTICSLELSIVSARVQIGYSTQFHTVVDRKHKVHPHWLGEYNNVIPHDDVITLKLFPHNWSYVTGINRWPAYSPYKRPLM